LGKFSGVNLVSFLVERFRIDCRIPDQIWSDLGKEFPKLRVAAGGTAGSVQAALERGSAP